MSKNYNTENNEATNTNNKNIYNLKKSDTVYRARILPAVGIYDLDELIIRTVETDYFVGVEKTTKTAFLLPYSSIDNTVFLKRGAALKKVRDAEQNKQD